MTVLILCQRDLLKLQQLLIRAQVLTREPLQSGRPTNQSCLVAFSCCCMTVSGTTSPGRTHSLVAGLEDSKAVGVNLGGKSKGQNP